MFVGAVTIELFLPESHSLKEKRKILNSILGKVRFKFNVSIAEIDHQDLWQRSVIGIACVSESSHQVKIILQRVRAFVEGLNKAEIIDERTSFFSPE